MGWGLRPGGEVSGAASTGGENHIIRGHLATFLIIVVTYRRHSSVAEQRVDAIRVLLHEPTYRVQDWS